MDFEESLALPSAILASVAQTSDRWAQRADRDRRRRKRTLVVSHGSVSILKEAGGGRRVRRLGRNADCSVGSIGSQSWFPSRLLPMIVA